MVSFVIFGIVSEEFGLIHVKKLSQFCVMLLGTLKGILMLILRGFKNLMFGVENLS